MPDITGLGEPIKKLIETVSEGLGVVGNELFRFDARKIKRIGAAEAEVEKQRIIAEAEGQSGAIEILGRAQKRFALEQYNKQINLENILTKTKENLVEKEVSDEPVERDWTMRFLELAQNISREELQDILAKILSGEIQRPNTFSYQTLEVIKYLSQKELSTFKRFVEISSDRGVIKIKGGGRASFEDYGLSFDNYLMLASIGLFNQSSTLSYDFKIPFGIPVHFDIGYDWFWISNDDKKAEKKIDFGLYAFSSVGQELRPLLVKQEDTEMSEKFKKDFIEAVEKRGLKIIRQERN